MGSGKPPCLGRGSYGQQHAPSSPAGGGVAGTQLEASLLCVRRLARC